MNIFPKLTKLLIAMLVVFILSLVGISFYAYKFFNFQCLATKEFIVATKEGLTAVNEGSTKVAPTKEAITNEGLTFEVVKGASIKKLAFDLKKQKIIKNPRLFYLVARLYHMDRGLKAGEYLIDATTTPKKLLENIIQGKVIQYPFTAIEGWNIYQLLEALKKAPKVKQTITTITTIANQITTNKGQSSQSSNQIDLATNLSAELLQAVAINLNLVNLEQKNPEGLFMPDTYYYTAQTTDVALLKRMNQASSEFLQNAWKNKTKEINLKDPYEVLILASIVEKETALLEEMPKVAGVYLRRLAKGMRLQADPTVVYGLGANFKGKLTKADLAIANPYNTYKNIGLPPSPIALPSRAAIKAVLSPDNSDNLYFVANGRGGHVFTSTLEAHNKAVANFRSVVKQSASESKDEDANAKASDNAKDKDANAVNSSVNPSVDVNVNESKHKSVQ